MTEFEMTRETTPGGTLAARWYAELPGAVLSAVSGRNGEVGIRRFTDAPNRVLQPALRENIICLHLGGPKRVERRFEGRASVHDVALNALTVMPALQSNSWLTHGPVDYVHVALDSEALRTVAMQEFGRDPDALALRDRVGFRAPEIEWLVKALLDSAAQSGDLVGRLYPESLMVVLMVALIRDHSGAPGRAGREASSLALRGGLPEWRLRRVIDFMTDRMDDDIGLGDLTSVAGLSRAQFFRAFKQSTGATPHRYLANLRLTRARTLLQETNLSIAEIAAVVGVKSEARLATAFRKHFAVSPARFRGLVR